VTEKLNMSVPQASFAPFVLNQLGLVRITKLEIEFENITILELLSVFYRIHFCIECYGIIDKILRDWKP